ncbi:MAG TPA: apolipoprotein N-acyltransferase [Acidimicrobiales bacterium]
MAFADVVHADDRATHHVVNVGARWDAVWRGLSAGLLVAAALPPFGWWPAALIGLAWWWHLLGDQPWPRRLLISWMVGLANFAVGISWFSEFSVPGYVISAVGEAGFWAAAGTVGGGDRRRWWMFPAALVVGDFARKSWPFGGIPLAGVELGQAAGPLAPAARIGGHLAVVAAAALVGVSLALAVVAARARSLPPSAGGLERPRTDWRAALARAGRAGSFVSLAIAVTAVAAGIVVPTGTVTGSIRVAAVQGGGPRGFTESESSAVEVFRRHVEATNMVEEGVDLIVWPEDVVDVFGTFEDSPEAEVMAGIARRFDTTVTAGIVEDGDGFRFYNAAVAWSPDGEIVGRYDKVRRVPYGEYFPFRSLVEKVATIPSRDAIPGDGPGFIDTPAAPLGFSISYEGFFADRARASVNAGAELLLVPTNAASFSGSIVPSQQLAAARLRTWETGKWVVQAGPTGFTAVIDDRGRIVARTDLSARQVLHERVVLRSGRTPYVVLGDWPIVGLALAIVAIAGGGGLRARRAGT